MWIFILQRTGRSPGWGFGNENFFLGVKCKTKFCRGVSSIRGKSPYCSKCRSRKWKLRNPLKYAFNLLRCGARRRGIAVTLTFSQYADFADRSGYALFKGRGRGALTIDRKDHTRGYCEDNLAVLTLSENASKAHHDGSWGKHKREGKVNENQTCECPF